MAGRGKSSSVSQTHTGRNTRPLSMSRPFLNLLILSGAVILFVKVGIRQGWIQWPPANLGSILASLAGWIALAGPLILFRHEEQTGGMGIGDRVWVTTGFLLWLKIAIQLFTGRFPSIEAVATIVGPTDMALISMACLAGGLIGRPKSSHWTWTNLVGWGLSLCWLSAVFLPADTSLARFFSLVMR